MTKTRQEKQIELHRSIADHYDVRYDHPCARIFYQYWNHAQLKHIPKQKFVKILDYGCGTGKLIEYVISQDDIQCEISGCDISEDMLKKVKIQSPKFKGVVVADGERLPFSANTFDIIICRGVLHHMPSLDRALNEIRRVLVSQGLFIVSEPSNDSVLIRLARTIMYKKSKGFDEDDKAFMTHELWDCFKRNKFSVTSVERFGFFAYTFAGFLDHVSILKYIPCNQLLTRSLIVCDKILACMPVIKNQSLHVIFTLSVQKGT